MTRIGLIDCDRTKFPNLALMKLSAYHKAQGDNVECYTLRNLGYWAYVMIYDKAHCHPQYKKLQRWVNNRFIFSKCEKFEDYDR